MSNIPTRQKQIKESTPSAEEQAFETYVTQNAEERLLEFVEEQITKMKQYSSLGNTNGSPGYYELNNALMQYGTIQCSLISMDVIAKNTLHNISEDFEQWLAEKYLEARSVLNPTSLSAQKWASSKELEMWVRVNYRDEYKKRSDEKSAAEMKVAFLRRLLDAWDSQKLILNRLCKNVEVEAMQLGANAFDTN